MIDLTSLNFIESFHRFKLLGDPDAKGYIDQTTQSLDITKFAYEHGAAPLLEFLDAEHSYRSTELSYRQSLATYMAALEQRRQAVGSRDLQ